MERRTFLKSTGASMIGHAAAIGGTLGAGSLLGLDSSRASAASRFVAAGKSGRSGPGKPLETLSDDLTPYTGTWGDVQLRHLLRRSMFGLSEPQFQYAQQALNSMDAIVTQLLACQDTTQVPLPSLVSSSVTWPNNYPDNTLTGNAAMNQSTLMFWENIELVNWWFDQMMQENLSIRQKMTLMWTNHFVTGSATVNIPGYMYYYLMMCMGNALGNFKDFATTVSTSSAMLAYLNGDQNYVKNGKPYVNENFAREVMELFTLGITFPDTTNGVIPNYMQNDIEESARALTGWQHSNKGATPTAPFAGVLWDGMNGNPSWHDTTSKTFLGQTGNWGLTDIINILFQQPTYTPASPAGIPAGYPQGYTAAYWACQKLYKEFVYYVPNASVVDAMARLMLNPASPYKPFDIAPVMQALLSSAHFYDANVIGAQIKSPVQYMGSLVREFAMTYPAFNPTDPPIKDTVAGLNTYTDTNPALSYMTNTIMNSSQGQQLLNPPNVAGWPGGENWLSAGSFQGRQNYSPLILANSANSQNTSLPEFDFYIYAQQIPNAVNQTEGGIAQGLEDLSLAFTLVNGGIESTALAPEPTLTLNFIDSMAQYGFANILTTLPEFQLF